MGLGPRNDGLADLPHPQAVPKEISGGRGQATKKTLRAVDPPIS